MKKIKEIIIGSTKFMLGGSIYRVLKSTKSKKVFYLIGITTVLLFVYLGMVLVVKI